MDDHVAQDGEPRTAHGVLARSAATLDARTEYALKWRRRDAADVTLGYYADGMTHRYTMYRDSSSWLLRVHRLATVAGVRVATGLVVDSSRDETRALSRAVAEAYERESAALPGSPGRMARAVCAAYGDTESGDSGA